MKHLKLKVLSSLLAVSVLAPSAGHAEQKHLTPPSTQKAVHDLPLGRPHLPQTESVSMLASGVTYIHVHRGYQSKDSYYTVDSPLFTDKKEAQSFSHKLKASGFDSMLHTVENTKDTDVTGKQLGYVVRTGHFKNEEDANQRLEKLKRLGFHVNVTYSEYDGSKKSTGPWDINILEINPNTFKGKLTSALSNNEIEGKEQVSSMAKRLNAIAGINGGYFVVGSNDGTPGDLAGIAVDHGRLVSESVGNRPSLILPFTNGKDAEIAPTQTKLSVSTPTGFSHVIDGLNRVPGLIRSCGGTGDQPTDQPQHDFTCTDPSEIIAFTRDFGSTTPDSPGFQVVLDSNGTVVKTTNSSTSIPENGKVLVATGEDIKWLKDYAIPGQKLNVSNQLYINGKNTALTPSMSVVNGSPFLVKNGRISIDAKKEGFDYTPDFYYGFGLTRQPRTLAGIKANGDLIFITVDGRSPENSIGVSFQESAELLKSLGAITAINLDGGGSTTMVINGKLINKPSDSTGERPIGDGIFITN